MALELGPIDQDSGGQWTAHGPVLPAVDVEVGIGSLPELSFITVLTDVAHEVDKRGFVRRFVAQCVIMRCFRIDLANFQRLSANECAEFFRGHGLGHCLTLPSPGE